MINEKDVSIYSMVSCLSNALDLVSPAVAHHQKRCAYIAAAIGQKMGISGDTLSWVILAAMLHDCGAMSLQHKLDALDFDFDLGDPHHHAEVGYKFLIKLDSLLQSPHPVSISSMVRHHHVNWQYGRGRRFKNRIVAMESHLIHLADRVEVLCKRGRHPLDQVESICAKIDKASGAVFVPEMVEAFKQVAVRESFWLSLGYPNEVEYYLEKTTMPAGALGSDNNLLINAAEIIAEVVDFRSPFTATHSSGVAKVAQQMAAIAGFSKNQCLMMGIAGSLHDMGKLAVPSEILDKPSLLEPAEMSIVKTHPYHTYRLLRPFTGMKEIAQWAAYHHETMDGSGYPFRLGSDDLPLGSRIVAAADIYTALTEDRPYRRGLSREKALAIIKEMAKAEKLDKLVVSLLSENVVQIDAARVQAQEQRVRDYNTLLSAA